MVCPKCGKTVPDNAKFCGFCGTKLGGGEGGLVPKNEKIAVKPTSAVQPVKVEKGAAVAVKPRMSGNKKILFAAAIVVVLLAAAILCFVLLGRAGSRNAYICLSDGRYELITDLSERDMMEIASSRSDYGDLWFTPDGKYIYYFSKLDSQYGSGTLCRAEYGKMKDNSSKNNRYVTVVATNASHDFDILDDGTILYANEDDTLYYFDGEQSTQIARDVDFYETELDDKDNLIYLVEDENGTNAFSCTMYLTTLKDPGQRAELDDDVSTLIHFTEKGEITYTKYTDEGVDLYTMTLEDQKPQLLDENVNLHTYDDDKVIYSVLKEKRGLDAFVEGTRVSGPVDQNDYKIPSYSYYYISDASDLTSYDGLCTSCEAGLNFFRAVMGARYSIEDAAGSSDSTVSTACQSFLDKYENYQTNTDGFIEVDAAVQADLQLLAQACGAPDLWYQLCIGKRQTGTSYDWDAYNAAVEQAALWEDLEDEDRYNLPIYTLKKYENGESTVIWDDLSACGTGTGLVEFASVEDLVSLVNVDEVSSASEVEYELSSDVERYSRILLYRTDEQKTVEMSTESASMMMDDGYIDDIVFAGQNVFVQNSESVLYVSPIEDGVADSFTVVSDTGLILGAKDGKLYYREGYYTDDKNNEYADLCVYENGESSRLLTDVNPYSIWVYEDGSVVAKTYQDLDGTGELVLLDAKGEQTVLADEVGSFVRPDASELLYISDDDLYLYDGKEKSRVATDVERIWCRETMKPVLGAGSND